MSARVLAADREPTPTMLATLAFIAGFHAVSGFAPSLAEIAQRFQISRPAVKRRTIDLQQRGVLKARFGLPRTFVVSAEKLSPTSSAKFQELLDAETTRLRDEQAA